MGKVLRIPGHAQSSCFLTGYSPQRVTMDAMVVRPEHSLVLALSKTQSATPICVAATDFLKPLTSLLLSLFIIPCPRLCELGLVWGWGG